MRDIAHAAKVSTDTVSRLELGEQLKDRTLDDIRGVFEAAGVEFFNDSGVKLKAKPSAPSGGSTRKPASTKKAAAAGAKKPTASDRQASPAGPSSKEAQIRALREQDAG